MDLGLQGVSSLTRGIFSMKLAIIYLFFAAWAIWATQSLVLGQLQPGQSSAGDVTVYQMTPPNPDSGYPIWTQPNDPNLSLNGFMDGMGAGLLIWSTSMSFGWIWRQAVDLLDWK